MSYSLGKAIVDTAMGLAAGLAGRGLAAAAIHQMLLQADVTASNAADQFLLTRVGLSGPPGIIFFGAGGCELGNTRGVGNGNADVFLASLREAGAAQAGPRP